MLYQIFYEFGRDLYRQKRKVKGVYADNWMSPKCRIRLDQSNGKYHLAGVPNQDMTMLIVVNGKRGESHHLTSNKYEQFEFELGAESEARLDLRFSKWFEDSHKRRLSFLIYDTDLFMPYDL